MDMKHPTEKFRPVIVTGLSGGGKSLAARYMEDLGYFCVDNLPPVFIPKFIDLCRETHGQISRAAIVVDTRSREFFDDFVRVLGELDAGGVPYELLFIEASDDVIIRRYKAEGRRAELQEAIKELHRNFRPQKMTVPPDLAFLFGKYLDDYLHDIEICQAFARKNREVIARILLERTGLTAGEAFHTIHNYIDTEERILRKGAIAAHAGERVLIPINMRDGSILAVGRGAADWNYSAPHGAGRIMSRKAAKEMLSMDEFRETMADVYTTAVNENTLDEAPMAYKSLADIIDVIEDSVDVIEVLKPIYNFKAE